MTPDMINGLFELIGGCFLLLNCWRIYKDREVKGTSIFPVIFFTSWGFWNLYFYPSMGAWYSFYGGMLIAAANTVWISLVIYYKAYRPPASKDAVEDTDTDGPKGTG